MRKKFLWAALACASILMASCARVTSSTQQAASPVENPSTEVTPAAVVLDKTGGEVVIMNNQLFLDRVFDYTNSAEWKYKGDRPAIIDLYADWCGPCRMVAPIMKDLAKEYDGKIMIYKVNVDKEKELASLFNATSIPLFVFIPMNGEPQLFRGAADKATYTKVIEEFLLKQ